MLIACIESGNLRTLGQWAETTRLGRDLVRTGRIGNRGFLDTLGALQNFQKIAQQYTGRVIAVGTQVFRAAVNRDQIIRRIKTETGLSVEILSETEEADYGYKGVLTGMRLEETLVIDVGGGSVELIRGRRDREIAVTSIPMGAVTLTEKYVAHDPPNPSEVHALKADFKSAIGESWLKLLQAPLPWICIGGTATTVASCLMGLNTYDARKLENFYLSRDDLTALIRRFLEMNLSDRRAYVQIDPKRADIIIAGSLIFESLMQLGGKKRCLISDRGLRYGIANRELQSQN